MNQNHFHVVLAPHISEKSTLANERGEYVFKVKKEANKLQIKSAIEKLFQTQVDRVRVVNVKTKPKRFGRVEGRSKGWKKAYVTLGAGHQINFGEV